MATIANLAVMLSCNSAALTTGMDDAARTVGSVTEATNAANKALLSAQISASKFYTGIAEGKSSLRSLFARGDVLEEQHIAQQSAAKIAAIETEQAERAQVKITKLRHEHAMKRVAIEKAAAKMEWQAIRRSAGTDAEPAADMGAAFGRGAKTSEAWAKGFAKNGAKAAADIGGAADDAWSLSAGKFERKFIKLIKGGGAAMVFTFIGKQLNHALEGTEAALERVHSGELSAAEGAEEIGQAFARSLPVFGQFLEAGQKIGGMLDGSTRAAADFAKMIEQHAAKAAEAEKGNQTYEASFESLQTQILSARRQIELMNADEKDKPAIQATFDLQDALAQVEAFRKKADALGQQDGFKKEAEMVRGLANALENAVYQRDALTRAQINAAANAENKKGIEELTGKIANFGKTPLDALLKRVGETEGPAAVAFVQKLIDKLKELENQKAGEDKVKSILEGLKSKFSDLGSPAEQLVGSLMDANATKEQIADALRLQDAYTKLADRAKERKDMEEQAKKIMEETLTPAEKFTKERERVAELLGNQLITQEAYDRKVSALRKEMESPTKSAQSSVATAAREFRFTSNVPNTAVEKTAKSQLDEAKKTNERLKNINDKLSDEAISYELVAIT